MSLFKPSNLTPNFESVIYNEPLFLTFQVNSNESKVTAYRVQILTDFNDKDDPDKNIIGTIYGKFEKPLYNKDIGEILLTQETLNYNGIFLEPNKDYRWKLRLYSEVKNQSITEIECDAPIGISNGIMSVNAIRSVDICKDFDIQIKGNSTTKNFLIISQEDIGTYLTDMMQFAYGSIQTFCDILRTKNNKFYIYTSDIASKEKEERIDFFKNKIHPTMYIYQFKFDDSSVNKYVTLSSENQYAISYSYINYYTNNTDIDLTYIGNGMLVGSTKQVMWTQQYNSYMKVNSYAQLLITANRMDFQPFLEDSFVIERSVEEGMSAKNYITVDKSDIKKEYLKNMTNGNFYLLLFNEKPSSIKEGDIDDFLTIGLSNKIISVEKYNDTKIRIYTSNYEKIQNYDQSSYKYVSLFYIQRQKIIQIDKNIGENNLVKITFEKPFDYNPENNQNIYFGYVSDDFDYDRVYITPVEEFDNSDGFAYIYLFSLDGEEKGSNLTQSDIDKMIKEGNCFKIINYVSSTGEVTLYGKASFIPTIQIQYQIYKRNSDGTTYNLITGTGTSIEGSGGSAFLGGKGKGSVPLVSNHSVDGVILRENTTDDSTTASPTAAFDRLFIQPNIGIKNDIYHPNVLEIYNQKYKNRLCITNLYNEYYQKYTQYGIETESIDTLDDTMYYITAKNTDNRDYNLGSHGESGNAYGLYNPQTQYKIYSNFVDCVPEGFFYSRYDKSIKFEIYNLNTINSEINQDVYIIKNNRIYHNVEVKENNRIYYEEEVVANIPFRDLYIKTICQDYKVINRTKSTSISSGYPSFLNGKQYFVGISEDSGILSENNLEEINLTSEGGSFKQITEKGDYDKYGIGYDIKVVPNKKYTVSVTGDNYYISIGLYNLEGNRTRCLKNQTEFVTEDGEYYAIITIYSVQNDALTTYFNLKVNNEPIISFKEELGVNNVPIKEYHYEIMSEDKTIIYSTEEIYDGKFCCQFRGCNNNSAYYIKVYIEDNYGKVYTSQIKIPIHYNELIDNTHIVITPLCEKQAVKIDFASIKEVQGDGKVTIDNKGYASILNNDTGLTYEKADKNKNILQIPQYFSYLTQFVLNSNIVYTKERRLVNKIVSDNSKTGDIYYLYFDAKPYLYNNNVYDLNPTYMKFIVTVNKEISKEEKIISDNKTIFIKEVVLSSENNFIIPKQFAFIATTETITNENEKPVVKYHNDYIYIIPDSLLDIEEKQRTKFKETVPTGCIDGNDLSLYNKDESNPSNDIYLVNDTSEYISHNQTVLGNMKVQTFKIIKTEKTLKITME